MVQITTKELGVKINNPVPTCTVHFQGENRRHAPAAGSIDRQIDHAIDGARPIVY